MAEVKRVNKVKTRTPGFWSTWKTVILEPVQFFEKLPPKTSYREPSLFYLKTQALLLFICLLILGQILISDISSTQSAIVTIIGGIAGVMIFIGFIIFYPLALLLSWGFLFINAALLHLFVILFGGEEGYKETVNVTAYSAAPTLLSLIPFVGLAAIIYSIILQVIGIQKRQKLSLGKSIAVVVIPFLIFLLPVIIIISYELMYMN